MWLSISARRMSWYQEHPKIYPCRLITPIVLELPIPLGCLEAVCLSSTTAWRISGAIRHNSVTLTIEGDYIQQPAPQQKNGPNGAVVVSAQDKMGCQWIVPHPLMTGEGHILPLLSARRPAVLPPASSDRPAWTDRPDRGLRPMPESTAAAICRNGSWAGR